MPSSTTTPPHEEDDNVNEGVLKDILDELDRERSRRAEMEDKIRKLEEEKSILEDSQRVQDERTRTAESMQVSYHSFLAMEAKVKGFQQLVDALTIGKPAIAAAMEQEEKQNNNNDTKTLPLHIVRLLEVLPWDPRVQRHIFAKETILEWQVYRNGTWQGQLGVFPAQFRTLRVAASADTPEAEAQNNNLISFLATMERQALGKNRKLDRVLTNASVTLLYETDVGYPLPDDPTTGTWQWAGGWKMDAAADEDPRCDTDGWAYGKKPQDFYVPSVVDASKKNTTLRRRVWTRQRVLVDYPLACASTRHYLQLVAEKANLSFAADKINQQLVETKSTLTETEQLLVEAKQSREGNEDMTNTVLEMKVKDVQEADDTMNDNSSRSKSSDSTKGTDLMKHHTQWVHPPNARKTSEDMTISDESMEEGSIHEYSVGSTETDMLHGKFDWKKLSRGTVHKWKAVAQSRQAQFSITGPALFRKQHSLVVDPADDDDDEL